MVIVILICVPIYGEKISFIGDGVVENCILI